MKIFEKMLALALLCTMLFSLAACAGGDNGEGTGNPSMGPVDMLPGYAYDDMDMSQYVSFGDWNYRDMQITVEDVAPVDDAAVKAEFNSYFNNSKNMYYQAIADASKPVANGDYVYLLYSGVTRKALEEAVSAGKIADVRCTGMSYTDIVALGLGFSGGTSTSVGYLEIGSNTLISGFESGLIGYVPAESGEENPVRLELSFPENYGNTELAGQPVIFFCKLLYIGDVSAGAFTADTISVDYVNAILNLSGEHAYPSLEACFAQIKKGMEQNRETTLYNAKANAIFAELAAKASIPSVPDEMLTTYVESVLSTYLADMVDMYNNYPSYYASMFGTATPSKELVAQYLGYKDADYMTAMKTDATPAVKNEMIFWFFVQQEELSLSEAEIAERRAEYVEKYGESIFTGVTDEVIYEQFLRDKFVGDLIEDLEAKGHITYAVAEE